jgi:preflagellin peptidase FlaK
LIYLLKILLIVAALSYASFQDIKRREVDDKIWLVAIPLGAILTATEILTTPGYQLVVAGISITLSVLLALAIFYTGLYGGADAKALIAVAATLPLPPYPQYISPFYPLAVFGNALILSLLLIPVCLIWNLAFASTKKTLFGGIKATVSQKAVALFTGIRVRPETARSVHFDLMEQVSNGGNKVKNKYGDSGDYGNANPNEDTGTQKRWHYLRLFHKVEDIEEPKVIDPQSEYVWVTPAIPLIVFLLVGFLISFVVGDLVFKVVSFLLGIFI